MTHDQIDRMVRKANPVRDPNTLGPVDVSVLTTPLERRMDMQTDNREVTAGGGQNRSRGPLVGIATAAVILIAGLVFFLTRDDAQVAEPAPNATAIPAMRWTRHLRPAPTSSTPTETKSRRSEEPS